VPNPQTTTPKPQILGPEDFKRGIHENQGFTLEGIPNYIYHHKYKLMRWFEDNSQCPLHQQGGFPAWLGYKSTMASGPAITTPKKGLAGNRSLYVQGFCPSIESSQFGCVREGGEIKARVYGETGIKIRVDDFICSLQDISLYKRTDGFVGIRFDFASCSGKIDLGFSNLHVPKTSSINMQLTEETTYLAMKMGKNKDQGSPGFTDFFKAICGHGEPATFATSLIPHFYNIPRKPGFVQRTVNDTPVCFAQSGNAAHVIGKSCFDDFLFFDFHGPFGHLAEIPAKDLDSLRKMIPSHQLPVHPNIAGLVGTHPQTSMHLHNRVTAGGPASCLKWSLGDARGACNSVALARRCRLL